MLNLITALTLFSRAPPYDTLTTDEKTLKTWLLIEITYIISLVAATMLHYFLRVTIGKPEIRLEYSSESDPKIDYLSSEDRQLLITIFVQPLSPMITQLFIDQYIEDATDITDAAYDIIMFQWWLQSVQIVCFLWVTIVPISPGTRWCQCSSRIHDFFVRWNRYIDLLLTQTYFIYVPIIAIVYTFWVSHATVFAKGNNLTPFTCFYPLVGMCNIIYYFWQIRDAVSSLNEGLWNYNDMLWEGRVGDIMHVWSWDKLRHVEFNLCESVAIYRILPTWYKDEQKGWLGRMFAPEKILYAKSEAFTAQA